MIEVMEAVAGAIGAERCGVRLSPYNSFLDAQDSVARAVEKNVWLMQQLDARVPGLAYIHMVSRPTIHTPPSTVQIAALGAGRS
jgi:2,4-dienoyl-CoA reductase-like NADH-dependent reductase (Old Yellow Enzyme family)